jgi:hypothetical protein
LNACRYKIDSFPVSAELIYPKADGIACEMSRLQVENIKWTFVFYEDGLAVNVLYTVDDPKKRAVGFKLSEGMEVPKELEEKKFKFARQKSKLAGTIRGSFFVIKGEY